MRSDTASPRILPSAAASEREGEPESQAALGLSSEVLYELLDYVIAIALAKIARTTATTAQTSEELRASPVASATDAAVKATAASGLLADETYAPWASRRARANALGLHLLLVSGANLCDGMPVMGQSHRAPAQTIGIAQLEASSFSAAAFLEWVQTPAVSRRLSSGAKDLAVSRMIAQGATDYAESCSTEDGPLPVAAAAPSPPPSQRSGGWTCPRCTFLHDSAASRHFLACEVCGLKRPIGGCLTSCSRSTWSTAPTTPT